MDFVDRWQLHFSLRNRLYRFYSIDGYLQPYSTIDCLTAENIRRVRKHFIERISYKSVERYKNDEENFHFYIDEQFHADTSRFLSNFIVEIIFTAKAYRSRFFVFINPLLDLVPGNKFQ